MNSLEEIKNLPDISFIDNKSLDEIYNQLINDYLKKLEEMTGEKKTLALADKNRLILNAVALQIYQMYQFIDRAGKQNTLKYSYGDFLDNMAAFKGVKRLEAQPSTTTVRISLSKVMDSTVVIPVGTTISTSDFKFFWRTEQYYEIKPGNISVDATFICTETGENSNGFVPGEINTLSAPLAYVNSAINITTSSGGSDIETDNSLAERTMLAPTAYSTAGTEDAYIYHVKTFNPNITSVKVYTTKDAVVNIVVLTNDGIPDEETLNQLAEYIENVRPLTDKVEIKIPSVIDYSINATYYIDSVNQANVDEIVKNITASVNEYIALQSKTIGKDVNPSVLIQFMMNAGARRVILSEPVYTIVDDLSVATNKPIVNIKYGGIEND